MKTFTEKTIQDELEQLNDWKFKNNSIQKEFEFKDFSKALAFIVQIGIFAEKQNHHPEIKNVYNKVSLRLTTHDSDGVTEKDIKLALAIDKI
ncbi:4a-hydroxytetrahydrobiopterin dehydratase [Flavobacterium azooxidireducens]|uniref:Putative pterin-4-alpha-carbinolamine dehydratase n=1 Tax=Flavobacterium azooxidireducens TaxID=1871076 RepID=A0ABY4KJN7_9FLAO|nr:4a-hydroxytetrahydrobiopterin dehydratase [Flavobacterium azooxidireducens]UPQ79868.1 4a-hydroxytetrahydrobiopterin dehydratase [Flavobacterium azooxidireducens]